MQPLIRNDDCYLIAGHYNKVYKRMQLVSQKYKKVKEKWKIKYYL